MMNISHEARVSGQGGGVVPPPMEGSSFSDLIHLHGVEQIIVIAMCSHHSEALSRPRSDCKFGLAYNSIIGRNSINRMY